MNKEKKISSSIPMRWIISTEKITIRLNYWWMRQKPLPAAPTSASISSTISSGLHLCIRQPRLSLRIGTRAIDGGWLSDVYRPCSGCRPADAARSEQERFDLFNELPVGDRLDYTISYDFHLTNGRHSRLIHHHLTPILLSDDGRIWLALCTVSLAATDEPGHIIMQKNGERSYLNIPHCATSGKERRHNLERDRERCLRLSAQGYTMNDIADRLCKSVDTIKACKRNLSPRWAWRTLPKRCFMPRTIRWYNRNHISSNNGER